jgi:effector-binding domain-containing protein
LFAHSVIVPKSRQLWNNPARIKGKQDIEVQKVLYWVMASFAVVIIVGFALPRTHSFEVSTEIDAQPASVFALVNDFRRFSLWAPWADSDPNARFIYSGSSRGEGATMTWDGAIIGSGAQAITESRPFEYVGIAMNQGEAGEARSWFRLTPGTGTTIVHWGFEVDYGLNIVGRYFASMLGSVVARDYQAGLAGLKELAESLPRADFSDLEIEHLIVEPVEIAYLPTTSRPEPSAISEAMGKAYFEILTFIDEHELQDAGAPMSITRTFSGSEIVFDSAIPVRGVTETAPRDGVTVKLGKTYGGPVIRVRHVGSYRDLNVTHRKITAYLAALGIERNGAAWESYVSDPGNTPEAELLTYVYYPIKQI